MLCRYLCQSLIRWPGFYLRPAGWVHRHLGLPNQLHLHLHVPLHSLLTDPLLQDTLQARKDPSTHIIWCSSTQQTNKIMMYVIAMLYDITAQDKYFHVISIQQAQFYYSFAFTWIVYRIDLCAMIFMTSRICKLRNPSIVCCCGQYKTYIRVLLMVIHGLLVDLRNMSSFIASSPTPWG